MKIGVDGRSLREPLTGIGRYTYEMCAALGAGSADLRIYLPRTSGYAVPPGLDAHRSASRLPPIVWLQTTLPRLCRRDGIDVLWGPSHRLPLRLDHRIGAVVTIHDLVWIHAAETMHPRTWLGESLLMAAAIRRADAVVADSTATAEAIAARFGTTGRLVTVHPGTTRLPRVPGAEHALADRGISGPFALFVGTLEPRKNLGRLIEAYARLPADLRAGCPLVIAGGTGWKNTDVHALVRQHGVEADTRVLGYVDNATLAELYAACRVLVMPSLYEGFGFPVVEANAHGAPALIGDTSSLPEVGGDAAARVDPLDVADIAEGLRRLIADDAYRARLAAAAPANAARFSWPKAAAELMAVFERVAARTARGA